MRLMVEKNIFKIQFNFWKSNEENLSPENIIGILNIQRFGQTEKL